MLVAVATIVLHERRPQCCIAAGFSPLTGYCSGHCIGQPNSVWARRCTVHIWEPCSCVGTDPAWEQGEEEEEEEE